MWSQREKERKKPNFARDLLRKEAMIYFYDGSKTGFLTSLVRSYDDGEAFLTSGNAQLSLGQKTVFVRPSPAVAAKAEERLLSFDKDCMADLDYLLRCGSSDKDNVALFYFRFLAMKRGPVRKMSGENAVFAAQTNMRRVTLEVHRFHGFVRFLESESGALYSPISPDNDICDLLVPHFRARMPEIPFVIHDVKRARAAVYDGEHTFAAPLEKAESAISANGKQWQTLWGRFFEGVKLPERDRLRTLRSSMPVRYWDFLPEAENS